LLTIGIKIWTILNRISCCKPAALLKTFTTVF